jgi:hypothetical protein
LLPAKKSIPKPALCVMGKTGDADGPAVIELNIHPAKLSDPQLAAQSDGALFWKITTGKKPMPAYGKRLLRSRSLESGELCSHAFKAIRHCLPAFFRTASDSCKARRCKHSLRCVLPSKSACISGEQRPVQGNDDVTFAIRKKTRSGAMHYEKTRTYENNSCLYKNCSAFRSSDVRGRVCARGHVLVDKLSIRHPGVAQHVDPNLVNPWGMAASGNGVIWVSDNGTGVSTLYNQDGTARSLVVEIPTAARNRGTGNPTGVVFNTTAFFQVTKNGTSAPAIFIFVSEDGSISGWNPIWIKPTRLSLSITARTMVLIARFTKAPRLGWPTGTIFCT